MLNRLPRRVDPYTHRLIGQRHEIWQTLCEGGSQSLAEEETIFLRHTLLLL